MALSVARPGVSAAADGQAAAPQQVAHAADRHEFERRQPAGLPDSGRLGRPGSLRRPICLDGFRYQRSARRNPPGGKRLAAHAD